MSDDPEKSITVRATGPIDEIPSHYPAFLAELVPDSMRGKEMLRGRVLVMGASSLSTVEYEHVMISETKYDSQPFDSGYNKITVRFKNSACQQPAAH